MSFIGRRPVMTKNKQNVEPHEWYAYKREHPGRYGILKEYIRECTWNGYQPKSSAFDLLPPAVPDHWPKTRDYYIVEPVVPRELFQYGRMLQFLTEHRHLKNYSHLFFSQGEEGVGFGWDIPDAFLCDYFWSEVKAVLAILENLESSE